MDQIGLPLRLEGTFADCSGERCGRTWISVVRDTVTGRELIYLCAEIECACGCLSASDQASRENWGENGILQLYIGYGSDGARDLEVEV